MESWTRDMENESKSAWDGFEGPTEEQVNYCIRCGLCLSVCPTYKDSLRETESPRARVALVAKALEGELDLTRNFKDHMYRCLACLACQDICPVNIDIPRMLLALRTKLAEGDTVWGVTPVDRKEKMLFQAWSWMIRNRKRYDFALKLAAKGQKLFTQKNGMIRRLPPPSHGWTKGRDIRRLAAESFISRWKKGI